MTSTRWRAAALAGIMLASAPAAASVKDGVEAWAKGDYKAAVEQWRGPAIAGDADAQYDMGQAYLLGRGVAADAAQAETWFARAAAQGHEQAQDAYGLALHREHKLAEALPWLEKSVARDEKRAELVLGTMLFNGDGVTKDWVRAYALVNRSSQQGLAQAGPPLAQMDDFLDPEQRQQGLAMASDIERHAKMARADGAGTGRPNGPILASETPPGRTPPPAHAAPPPRAAPATKPVATTKPAATTPVAEHPTPPPVARAGGHWRVQLGAFREPGGAQALWAKLGKRVGGQPSYIKTGDVTHLQAGPFASKQEAEHACHAAGVSCLVVAP